jgi:hypothetical protein
MHLALLAIIRNECATLDEWLSHHTAQGFTAFFLVDNESDERCEAVYTRHAERTTRLTWRGHPCSATACTSEHANATNQVRAYQHAWARMPAAAIGWLALLDADEFLYATDARSTVAAQLNAAPANVQQVCTPWIRFGSSNLTRQPRCIRAANTRREALTQRLGTDPGGRCHKRGGCPPPPLQGKCITRASALSADGAGLAVHRPVLHGDSWTHRNPTRCVCGDLQTPCREGPNAPSLACHLTEASLSTERLRLHHYVTQSAERMKARGAARVHRGHDADIQGWTEFRMAEWWRRTEAESNRVLDATLAQRQILRARPRGSCSDQILL